MINLEWAHLIIGVISAVGGGGAGLVAGVWRIARIEGRLELSFQTSIADSEKRFEVKVEQTTAEFGETLKALRQKINDVELETERRFLPKGDFDDFRNEYREDMRDLKNSIARIPRTQ